MKKFPKLRQAALLLLLPILLSSPSEMPGASRAEEVARQKTELMMQALRAREQGDHIAASEALRGLLALNPENASVKRMLTEENEAISATLGEASADTGEIQQLMQAEAQRLAAAPALAKHAQEKARKLLRDGKPEEAVAVVMEVLEGPPMPPGIREELAVFLAGIDETPPAARPPPSPDGLLVRGRAHLLDGNTDQAIEAADLAVKTSPGDPIVEETAAGIKREAGAMERQTSRESMLQDVSTRWRQPNFYNSGGIELNETRESNLQTRLKSIEVPKVSFTATPLSQVLDTLAALAEEQGKPVNLVLLRQGGEDPLIDITLRELTLGRVLSFLAEASGYEHHIESDAVVLRPAVGPTAYLQTEFLPINRSTILRLTGLDTTEASTVDPFTGAPSPVSSQSLHQAEEAALLAFFERAGAPFSGVAGASLALTDGQLIVTQTPGNLKKVREILSHYAETKQVEIEARFLEVQEGMLEEFGVEWLISNLAAANEGGASELYRSQNRSLARAFGGDAVEGELIITGLGDGVGTDGTIRQPIRPPEVRNGIDLGASALGLAEIAGMVDEFDVDAVIRALARQTGNDLMSAPRITVLSGKKAEIVVAQEMIYPRSFGDMEASVGRGSSLAGSAGVAVTAGTPRDFVTRNVGVEMEVTATVEEDNSISLLLEPKVTEFEGFVEYGGPSVAIAGGTTVTVPSGFFQPVFSIRRVRTEVTIWDGATVVMGGLTREQAVTVKDKVPLLGDIPLVGRLFRSEGESTQKKNLLIFVTARLVSPGGAPVRRVEGTEMNVGAEE